MADWKTSAIGFGVLFLSVSVFLVALYAVIALVKFLMG